MTWPLLPCSLLTGKSLQVKVPDFRFFLLYCMYNDRKCSIFLWHHTSSYCPTPRRLKAGLKPLVITITHQSPRPHPVRCNKTTRAFIHYKTALISTPYSSGSYSGQIRCYDRIHVVLAANQYCNRGLITSWCLSHAVIRMGTWAIASTWLSDLCFWRVAKVIAHGSGLFFFCAGRV